MRTVSARDAAEAIVAEAGGRADIFVTMSAHGRGGFGRRLMGSVAERVLQAAASPVLLDHPSVG